jgi:hypothetical protein
MNGMRSIRWILMMMIMVVGMIFATSTVSSAQVSVGVSVSFGPPAIPIYEQPILPAEGYIWVPGYWAWADGDYFWVPGTWVLAPEPGFLWTPGYWAWGGNGFFFHEGYWGPLVGFYGGINYGFGYFGVGYQGGRWENGRFFYNRYVNNVNVTIIHNVYNTTIINDNESRISYNGGEGGINARPTPEQEAAAHEKHISVVSAQVQHEQAARDNPQQRASVNRGKPPVAATPAPGALNDRGAVQAKDAGAPYRPPAGRGAMNAPETGGASRNAPPVHVKDLPPAERPAAPSTGNPKMDQKYQQQQDKMYQKQQQEREKLQQQQEQQHQKMTQQKANDAKVQQLEQQHQQQTQQLQQKHAQQQQQLQQKMQKQNPNPNPNANKPPKP